MGFEYQHIFTELLKTHTHWSDGERNVCIDIRKGSIAVFSVRKQQTECRCLTRSDRPLNDGQTAGWLGDRIDGHVTFFLDKT